MNEEQAVAIARRTAEQEGWAWVDPPLATLRKGWSGRSGRWEIFSNARALGAKVRVVLDDETGTVTEKGYVPR
jgi:hypothetical protein